MEQMLSFVIPVLNEQDSLITLATCTSVPTHRLFIIGVRDRPEGTVQ